ncbi:hypothetical protein ACVIIW_006876 [Bradyrhizobium sp. USDA 4449]
MIRKCVKRFSARGSWHHHTDNGIAALSCMTLTLKLLVAPNDVTYCASSV